LPTEGESPTPSSVCRITQLPPEITYFGNGLKYYCVEVTCEDGTQYAIQGYGDDAQALYIEAHRCMLCGTPVVERKKELLKEKGSDGRIVLVDKSCKGLITKFESVYGPAFFKNH